MKIFELKMHLIALLAVMCCLLGIGSQVAQAQSPTGPFAYVTNQYDNTVSVIDTSSNTVVATISLPAVCDGSCSPAGLAVTPDGSRVYVAGQYSGTVSVIATSTNTVSATITIPSSRPVGVAITPDGTRAYVTDTSRSAIYVIDTNPLSPTYNTVTNTITPDASNPNGPIAITPDGSAAFYTFGTESGSVGRIDTSTNNYTNTINVGSKPTGIAVTPNNAFIYVTNNGGSAVSVIPNIFPTFAPITSVTVGSGPYSVAFTPNGALAYVVNQGSNSVSVISTTTQSVVATVAATCIFTNQIAITPDGTQAYVADNECSRADVISTASNMVTTSVGVGNGPFGVAVGPTGTATTFTTPQQPIAPGTTTTFTDGTIIKQTLQLPADVIMGGAAFMAVKFMQIPPTVFDATRIPVTGATAPNTWSGGTAVPAGTTLTPLEGAGGNGIVAEKLCFGPDPGRVPIVPCQIFAQTTLIQLTSFYNTQSPQPNPAIIIATDGQNDWANITVGFNLDCCSGSGASKGLNTDEAIVNLPPIKDTSSIIRVIGDLQNAGCIDNAGIANALTSKLSAAQDAISRGDVQTAINILTAFKKQVQAQSGKHIATSCTIATATFNPMTVLLTDTQSLIDSLRTSITPDPITGFIIDSNGAGISGATVSILSTGVTATSDITGFYFFPTTGVLTSSSSYTVQVTAWPSVFTTSTPASKTFTWFGSGMVLSNFVLK